MPIPRPKNGRPFSQISMDFIKDLPEIDGYDSLMVIVDQGLTKRVILYPCTKTIDALGTANALLDTVYKQFGLSESIISDRGPQFAAKVFTKLGQLLGITLKKSTAYHPQTDGGTEQVNQEMEVYFQIFCYNNPETWKQNLATMEFAHNQRPHSSRKRTLFHLMMGYEPTTIPTITDKSNIPLVEKRIEDIKRARTEAIATHELA